MKTQKSIFLLIFFCCSLSYHAQNSDSLPNLNHINSKLYSSDFSSFDKTFLFKKLNFQDQPEPLLLYNSTNNSYNVYLKDSYGYSYIGSKTIFRHKSNSLTYNTLMPNSFLLIEEGVTYPVRDSFNPYGASNFKEALLGGLLGLLFD